MNLEKYYQGFESERLEFRPLEPEDVANWIPFFEDNANLELLGIDTEGDPVSLAQRWIHTQLERYDRNEFGHLAMIRKSDQTFVGTAGFKMIEYRGETVVSCICSILQPFWKNGFGVESCIRLVEVVFEEKVCTEVYFTAHERNIGSQKVIEKSGGKRIDQVKDHGRNVWVYRITKPVKRATHKEVALWTCPRSRSTLLARSFEQRSDCVVYDEPFYAPYLLEHGHHHPNWEQIVEVYETDFLKVINNLQTDLPEGKRFSFQKHIAKNILRDFGSHWFPKYNIFLLRHPKDILLSLEKVLGDKVTEEDIDIASLFRIFRQVNAYPNKIAMIIHSDDLVNDPAGTLRAVCERVGVPFQEDMLSWEPGLIDSNLFFTGKLLPFAESWYGNIKKSTGFQPLRSSNKELPAHLQPVLKACMPIYEELLKHQLVPV